MITVNVNLPHNGYDIYIGSQAQKEAAAFSSAHPYGTKVVISDETVWKLHGEQLCTHYQDAGIDFYSVIVPPGEDSKSMATLERLYEEFAKARLTRRGLIIAFGGGVIGDLAGFAAATWMRGVDYIQIPTTLLSQIDSSVGGKTAINLACGKNMAGAFYQPRFVAADTDLLNTLPPRELSCGMAEMVKYGALFSPELFEELTQPLRTERLPQLIETCCRLKASTVQADEKDTGQRMLLNLGHTFGHAIEKLGDFSRYNHGEGIAIGMMLAAIFGEKTGICKPELKDRMAAALNAQHLPTECPWPLPQLLDAMILDKKSRNDGLDLILLREIGQPEIIWHSITELESIFKEIRL